MGRFLLAVLVVIADTALQAAVWGDRAPVWSTPVYAAAVTLVVAARARSPLASFVAVLVLAYLTGGSYVLLLWSCYQTGRTTMSRRGVAVVTGASAGYLGARLVSTSTQPRELSGLIVTNLVFIALPVLVGRYIAQHQRLVATLDRHNQRLRREQELLAEQERLRERLRIARDMHDSLGHRLSLVSVQAAALEVSALPTEQRQAVARLAGATRDAVDELHDLVGTLRQQDCDRADHTHGLDGIDDVVTEFRKVGVPVTLRHQGDPRPLSPAAVRAAYRLVEEGLTNAARHAPGEQVTVSMEWEADALLLSVLNRLPEGTEAADDPGPFGVGHGLMGLAERALLADGFAEGRRLTGEFRLSAMLPVVAGDADAYETIGASGVDRIRTIALGAAIALLMFVFLPASMLFGVR